MRLLGAGHKTRVLVDHYAIENRFAAMLEELHRYDADTGQRGPVKVLNNDWINLELDPQHWQPYIRAELVIEQLYLENFGISRSRDARNFIRFLEFITPVENGAYWRGLPYIEG
jgi:hypothetical protein